MYQQQAQQPSKRRRRQHATTMMAIVCLFLVPPASEAFVAATARSPSKPFSLSATTAIPTSNTSTERRTSTTSTTDRLWPFPTRRRRRRQEEQEQQAQARLIAQARRDAWQKKYGSVQGLRDSFGTNRNGWWGDLDLRTTRRLYHCLQPVGLSELVEMEQQLNSQNNNNNDSTTNHLTDLAELAYAARKAAKLYARERCVFPGRWAAGLFDGMRQLQTYGSFDMQGMSFEQLWAKYEEQLQELDQEDLRNHVSLKIIERSCKSNAAIDRLLLGGKSRDDPSDDTFSSTTTTTLNQTDRMLGQFERQLEADVRALLADDNYHRITTFKALRAIATVRRRIVGFRRRLAANHTP